ncbi:MAG: hypothetical protein A2Y14_01395 [Verrucomicrobia bacterium GWF2_51_19]|nr:MAG: hypothetical protein A2Y14_01395 [Verrucomicrobia bacterium GWF2_51_19]HCJ11727.1 hypothetical protein [Opitutae bacterium]
MRLLPLFFVASLCCGRPITEYLIESCQKGDTNGIKKAAYNVDDYKDFDTCDESGLPPLFIIFSSAENSGKQLEHVKLLSYYGARFSVTNAQGLPFLSFFAGLALSGDVSYDIVQETLASADYKDFKAIDATEGNFLHFIFQQPLSNKTQLVLSRFFWVHNSIKIWRQADSFGNTPFYYFVKQLENDPDALTREQKVELVKLIAFNTPSNFEVSKSGQSILTLKSPEHVKDQTPKKLRKKTPESRRPLPAIQVEMPISSELMEVFREVYLFR